MLSPSTHHAAPPALVRRCAWCGNVWSAGGWAASARLSAEQTRTTHTICESCADVLRVSGRSR